VDLFHNEQIGESRSLTRQNYFGAGLGLAGMDERLANSVNYDSPSLGGAKITVNYGMANNNSETTAQDLTAMALGVQYAAGPLYVGAAYKTQEWDGGTVKNSDTGYRLSASFTMLNQALRLVGFYQQTTFDGAGGPDFGQMTYGAGASFKVGNGLIKGQYYVVDSFDEDPTGTTGANLMAIGYDHNLSKTTMVYATYAKVTNDDNAAFSVIGAGHANPADGSTGMPSTTSGAGAGQDPSAFSIGMKVKF
jgi:predicted porin